MLVVCRLRLRVACCLSLICARRVVLDHCLLCGVGCVTGVCCLSFVAYWC